MLSLVPPVTRGLLRPHLEDVDNKIQPGAVILTWASMNIDGYLHHIHQVYDKYIMSSMCCSAGAAMQVLPVNHTDRLTCCSHAICLISAQLKQINISAEINKVLIMQGLVRLEDLVHKINDSLDNRVGANLQAISKMRLVDLPLDRSFTYEDFVATQAKFVKKQAEMLAVK